MPIEKGAEEDNGNQAQGALAFQLLEHKGSYIPPDTLEEAPLI